MIKITNKVMEEAKKIESELRMKDIINYQYALENHKGDLEQFMANNQIDGICIDWEESATKVAIYNSLNNTMIRLNGKWLDK